MDIIEPAVRSYPWGSRTAIAALRGHEVPSPTPEAELWFGAHPAAPATINGTPLTELIDADPAAHIGQRVIDDFDGRLPFLLKILAAAQPLSLQAHPTKHQAEAGCAAEDAAGIPRTAPNRNYRDDNYKPELLVALTPFQALAGFRPIPQILDLVEQINAPELSRYTGMLSADGNPGDQLRALFTTWITIPAAARTSLVDAVTRACAARLHGPAMDEWMTRALRTSLVLADRYPGDAGVVCSLLLNNIVLNPGEAVFLAAGQLHAYIEGLGVEIMANSDNVLRGGLTPKHIDVPELVRVLNFQPLDDPRAPVDTRHDGEVIYRTPVPDFHLRRVTISSRQQRYDLEHDGPVIAVCTSGAVTLTAGHRVVDLKPGVGAWVDATDPTVVATGDGDVFFATA